MDEKDRCTLCKGEKIYEDKKEFEVKLDPGVPENHVYTFAGEGHEVVLHLKCMLSSRKPTRGT